MTEEDAKEQLIDGIGWTRDMLRQELEWAMLISRVNNHVLALGSIWVDTYLEPDGPCAMTEFDISSQAHPVWSTRIEDCISLLRSKGLKVEHFHPFNSLLDLYKHKIVVRHEYRGSLQE